ncbi:hypothetical protein PLICRDRAFT_110047 [Plicaturopsis crispa FD-325 SS-3]|nr:hypothetical protein PLICRDRAFT_110047 [Plicaturopsis crispa FD-325 SS-3]
MRSFLHIYTDDSHRLSTGTKDARWIAASLHVAHAAQRGPWFARRLREWTRAYISDRETLPVNIYGTWNRSALEDEDMANEIALHLQSIGKYVKALDIVFYLDRPEVKQRFQMKKTISLATAQRWMRRMGYRWTKNPSGQFVDGHEREDVVYFRQHVFLPAITDLEHRMRAWTLDNLEIVASGPRPRNKPVVAWFQDESTFYANDRRTTRWVHKDENAVPRAKGEGASLMVSDFVSADYGWLTSPDGTEKARVLFKAGVNREGYFTSDDIVAQTKVAMQILKDHYKDEEHVLIFDNATTHLKRADDALSARKMPKGTSKYDKNWGVVVNLTDADGNLVHGTDGKVIKVKRNMRDGYHGPNRKPQAFYFPPDHDDAGCFKGMKVILEERGFIKEARLNAGCRNFKCPKGATACCCRRVLYNQPDFVNEKSILEYLCEPEGFRVLFLPKFHCELNFIEQCWGAAKRTYRLNPTSSKEADLLTNLVNCLATVSVEVMRKYARRSLRFMDAYRIGLDGQKAAWAAKKYSGHRVLPASIMETLESVKF